MNISLTHHEQVDWNEEGAFRRMFVSFGVTQEIMKRAAIKIFSIDGAATKHKIFKYDQLVLEGRNGDWNNFICAYALVPSESADEYRYFFENLK